MPKIRWTGPLDLKVMISAANFLAIVFCGGMVWASTTGDIASNKAEIKELRAEIAKLRSQDTSIAVIKADVQTVKENLGELKTDLKTSVQRIESRIDQQQPRLR